MVDVSSLKIKSLEILRDAIESNAKEGLISLEFNLNNCIDNLSERTQEELLSLLSESSFLKKKELGKLFILSCAQLEDFSLICAENVLVRFEKEVEILINESLYNNILDTYKEDYLVLFLVYSNSFFLYCVRERRYEVFELIFTRLSENARELLDPLHYSIFHFAFSNALTMEQQKRFILNLTRIISFKESLGFYLLRLLSSESPPETLGCVLFLMGENNFKDVIKYIQRQDKFLDDITRNVVVEQIINSVYSYIVKHSFFGDISSNGSFLDFLLDHVNERTAIESLSSFTIEEQLQHILKCIRCNHSRLFSNFFMALHEDYIAVLLFSVLNDDDFILKCKDESFLKGRIVEIIAIHIFKMPELFNRFNMTAEEVFSLEKIILAHISCVEDLCVSDIYHRAKIIRFLSDFEEKDKYLPICIASRFVQIVKIFLEKQEDYKYIPLVLKYINLDSFVDIFKTFKDENMLINLVEILGKEGYIKILNSLNLKGLYYYDIDCFKLIEDVAVLSGFKQDEIHKLIGEIIAAQIRSVAEVSIESHAQAAQIPPVAEVSIESHAQATQIPPVAEVSIESHAQATQIPPVAEVSIESHAQAAQIPPVAEVSIESHAQATKFITVAEVYRGYDAQTPPVAKFFLESDAQATQFIPVDEVYREYDAQFTPVAEVYRGYDAQATQIPPVAESIESSYDNPEGRLRYFNECVENNKSILLGRFLMKITESQRVAILFSILSDNNFILKCEDETFLNGGIVKIIAIHIFKRLELFNRLEMNTEQVLFLEKITCAHISCIEYFCISDISSCAKMIRFFADFEEKDKYLPICIASRFVQIVKIFLEKQEDYKYIPLVLKYINLDSFVDIIKTLKHTNMLENFVSVLGQKTCIEIFDSLRLVNFQKNNQSNVLTQQRELIEEFKIVCYSNPEKLSKLIEESTAARVARAARGAHAAQKCFDKVAALAEQAAKNHDDKKLYSTSAAQSFEGAASPPSAAQSFEGAASPPSAAKRLEGFSSSPSIAKRLEGFSSSPSIAKRLEGFSSSPSIAKRLEGFASPPSFAKRLEGVASPPSAAKPVTESLPPPLAFRSCVSLDRSGGNKTTALGG